MKKVYYDWNDLNGQVADLARQINNSNFKPDYIVGITRGGLIPATMLSHMLGVKMYSLNVSLRDNDDPESNTWMAEDAYNDSKILIVDDINDTGETIKWIKEDWHAGVPGSTKADWDMHIWGDNVRVAVLVDNASSHSTVEYSAETVNKAEENCWIVYPWEQWWRL